ncbi:MAG TPA: alkaline phosphatase family protein [Marmoricola sp.]|nr:alkaline phosphatase family protein [Marmoricola sp.]
MSRSSRIRRSHLARGATLLVAPLLLLLGPAFAPARASAPDPAGDAGVPAFGHVFLVIGENTELGQINKSNAPYLLGQLAPQSAWLTGYYALTHFSEANYIGMTSGQYTHCQQFDGSVASCHQDVDNLFSQLDRAGVSWQSWMESMPEACGLSSAGSPKTQNHYGPKHNPALFYDAIEGAGGVWSATDRSAECQAQDLPMGGTGPNDTSTFDAALASGDVARFNFVVPNECEDGHDNCQPSGNGISQFDSFLAREVPKIISSPAFGSDGLLLVTFDEGTSNQGDGNGHQFAGGGNVAFLAYGPQVRTGVDTATYDHYSLLRTLEDGFGIGDHLGGAATASAISTIWK